MYQFFIIKQKLHPSAQNHKNANAILIRDGDQAPVSCLIQCKCIIGEIKGHASRQDVCLQFDHDVWYSPKELVELWQGKLGALALKETIRTERLRRNWRNCSGSAWRISVVPTDEQIQQDGLSKGLLFQSEYYRHRMCSDQMGVFNYVSSINASKDKFWASTLPKPLTAWISLRDTFEDDSW